MKTSQLVGNVGLKGLVRGEPVGRDRTEISNLPRGIRRMGAEFKSIVEKERGRVLCLMLLLLLTISSGLPLPLFVFSPT